MLQLTILALVKCAKGYLISPLGQHLRFMYGAQIIPPAASQYSVDSVWSQSEEYHLLSDQHHFLQQLGFPWRSSIPITQQAQSCLVYEI